MRKVSAGLISSKFFFRVALRCLRLLPRRRCGAFGSLNSKDYPRVEHIYVINLKRQSFRWEAIKKELKHILDRSGKELWHLAERHDAVDATFFLNDTLTNAEIDPIYTLRDQLFVEPQPLALPTQMELNARIRMSRPEIAVAHSHISIWKNVAASDYKYVLILEDDVWFRSGFARSLNKAWREVMSRDCTTGNFDILYLSYEEVKNGAPKTMLSKELFRPERGLWNLSGYILSREGAQKLLRLLPCRGPVDLWMNHQFGCLNVLALKHSVISQRPDFSSTNSYSILPTLTQIGAITSEAGSLFHARPSEGPVFVFGPKCSGLTSLAMALSMLGYRCCSDLLTLPSSEYETLTDGKDARVFDAYVNIGSLAAKAATIKELYPRAKFIFTALVTGIKDADDLLILDALSGADVVFLPNEVTDKWQIVCEHLRCSPPNCSFPALPDLGQRKLLCKKNGLNPVSNLAIPKRDQSPWVVESRYAWQGIHCAPAEIDSITAPTPTAISDCFQLIDTKHWIPRSDTFTDNLALFRPSNIELLSNHGAALRVKREDLGVRKYSAASLTSLNRYLYGRFEATIKVPKVPGVVTGFFLHRDSPRQEIDIEIVGNRTDRLLVNVFYNPGDDGAKFDYGYRGAATYIDLGFDASESYHQFAIEWWPNEILWFVDDCLVHRRVDWNPTPIPHLPMFVHVNVWPCRSRELAGRLLDRRLPAITFLKSLVLKANQTET